MFVVELVGLPGVGKSSISKALANRINVEMGRPCLTSQDALLYACRRHGDRVCRTLLHIAPDVFAKGLNWVVYKRTTFRYDKIIEFILRHHALVGHMLSGTSFQNMSYTDKHFVASAILHAGSIYESIRSLEQFDTVVVFDEGFIQWSLIMTSPTEVLFNTTEPVGFVTHAPLPDVVVYLKSDVDTCVSRMQNRRKGITRRLKTLDLPSVRESLRLMESTLSTVVEYVSRRGTTVVEVRSRSTVDETVAAVIDGLRTVLATV